MNTDSTDQQTWSRAQQWEREFWLRQQKNLAKNGKNIVFKILSSLGLMGRYRGNDYNQWWAEQFDGYSFLPPTVQEAIEVGCGPYTNMRFMVQKCSPARIVLSDPLIRTYINFPNTFVREAYRNGSCMIDDHPLEELPFRDGQFDVAIMNNVLDHVRDARLCMNSLVRILKPGGYVIIGQDLTNDEDRSRIPAGVKEGHPITLDASWFAPWIAEFEPIIHKELPRSQSRHQDQLHYATLIFAGRKR